MKEFLALVPTASSAPPPQDEEYRPEGEGQAPTPVLVEVHLGLDELAAQTVRELSTAGWRLVAAHVVPDGDEQQDDGGPAVDAVYLFEGVTLPEATAQEA